jgi:nitroreductase
MSKLDLSLKKLMVTRRSIRVMSGEPITKEELNEIFEAARWAASEWNDQPWRFLYAWAGTPEWELMFPVINEKNQKWTAKASVIILVLAKTVLDYKGRPGHSYSLGVGSACQNAALMAHSMGLAFCMIGGLDYQKAREAFGVEKEFEVSGIIAIGRPRAGFPTIPGVRKSVEEISKEGTFPSSWHMVPYEEKE